MAVTYTDVRDSCNHINNFFASVGNKLFDQFDKDVPAPYRNT